MEALDNLEDDNKLMIDGWGMGAGVQVHNISTNRRVPHDEGRTLVKRRAAWQAFSGNAGGGSAIYGANYKVQWGEWNNGAKKRRGTATPTRDRRQNHDDRGEAHGGDGDSRDAGDAQRKGEPQGTVADHKNRQGGCNTRCPARPKGVRDGLVTTANRGEEVEGGAHKGGDRE